jgi:23S rRNA (uracil1939-C5)-methyltransferase
MREYKKGDVVRLTLTDLNNLGCGVGRLDDGRVVFVRGGVCGDSVTAKIIKVNSSYLVAKLESVDKPSEHRIENDECAAPESCGGCIYRHITYERELELKHEYLVNVFKKAGLGDVKVGSVLTTGEVYGYRNKAQYPVMNTKNGLASGFYAAKTHKLAVNGGCPLQPKIFADIVDFICRFAEKNRVLAYDETNGTGVLRHIYIREGRGSGEIMVCLVLFCECPAFDTAFAKELISKFDKVTSVMLNYNRKNTNVVTGKEYLCIAGKEYIEDILLGQRFRIGPASFWQVNHDGAELLYRTVAEKAELSGNEVLLDLYCGTGSIGLTLAGKVKNLVGVEIVPEAVECAKVNAELNGIQNAEFYCGDASDTEGILGLAERKSGRKINADAVILDPPRKGSTPELIKYIAGRNIEKVIYVSCGPDTLARDCVEFMKYGYEISGEVTPVDMFPRTGHVETIVCLCKQ